MTASHKRWWCGPSRQPGLRGGLFALLACADWLAAFLLVRHLPGATFLYYFMLGFGFVLAFYALAVWCASCFDGEWAGAAAGIARRVMEIGALLWVASFLVIEAVIASGTASDAAPDADYLIVLGAGLWGETPSNILAVRLHAAEQYLKQNERTVAILSGGQGERESISEAEAMRRELTRAGIAPERLLLEDRSANTGENIAFSKAVLAAAQPVENPSIVVITSEFHLYRAKKICRREGLAATGLSAPTPYWYLKGVYFFREYFSVVFMMLGR